jgi:hypothetical protein
VTDWVKDACKKILRDASIPPTPRLSVASRGLPGARRRSQVRVRKYVWWNQCTPPATLDGQLGCRVKAVRTIRSRLAP